MKKLRLLAACCLPLWLASCATSSPPSSVSADLPSQWQAPLPHSGNIAQLSQWWQQLNDPLLAQLIEAAQAVNPTLATARSRIEQARATRVTAGAALLPTLDGSASASRGASQTTVPPVLATTLQGALQALWELDLFGGNRSASDAAQLRLQDTQALWHDARVSVAAEVANQYFSLRTCQRQLSVSGRDAVTRAETARLADLTSRAGFQAPAEAAWRGRALPKPRRAAHSTMRSNGSAASCGGCLVMRGRRRRRCFLPTMPRRRLTPGSDC